MAGIQLCPYCAGPVREGQRACSMCGRPLQRAAAPAPPAEERERAPNCFKCVHFMITHQPGHSRACRAFGFKGEDMPSYFVFNVTGKHCLFFEAKPDRAGS